MAFVYLRTCLSYNIGPRGIILSTHFASGQYIDKHPVQPISAHKSVVSRTAEI